MTVRLIAVDPWGCGCTECIVGEYVPLRYATEGNIADLLAGRLANHLNDGTELEITTTHRVDGIGKGKTIQVRSVTVTYVHHDGQSRTWELDPHRAGLAA